jgi:hypothetical protein
MAFVSKGVDAAEAAKRIWMFDSKGLVVKGRSTGGITHHKAPFAHEGPELTEFLACVEFIKPTGIIGACLPRLVSLIMISMQAWLPSRECSPRKFDLCLPSHFVSFNTSDLHTDGEAERETHHLCTLQPHLQGSTATWCRLFL